MNKLRHAYVDMYVATEKLRRQADRAEAEANRWTDRVALAERLGERDLARLARERALQAAEREVHLRAYVAGQDGCVEYACDLARDDRP